MDTASVNMVLFAGRLILAYNETLYPYHKWFFRVLESCPNKPEKLTEKSLEKTSQIISCFLKKNL